MGKTTERIDRSPTYGLHLPARWLPVLLVWLQLAPVAISQLNADSSLERVNIS